MRDLALTVVQVHHRARDGEKTPIVAARTHVGERAPLVHEDVRVVVTEVVQTEEVLVEEPRRPREGHEVRGTDLGHEPRGPGKLVGALAPTSLPGPRGSWPRSVPRTSCPSRGRRGSSTRTSSV